MTAPQLTALVRRRGFLVGAVIGAALANRTRRAGPDAIRAALEAGPVPLPPPAGRRDAPIALGDGLLEELLGGGVDLKRLAGRWIRWWQDDGHGADPALVEALTWLRDTDAPPPSLATTGPAALAAALPAGLASASPRAMTAGAFHTARLLDPAPDHCLAAVAIVVAAARLLEGSRDILPEVLALLRANQAPATLFERFVAIPRDPNSEPAVPRGATAGAIDVAVWTLWQAHHRPRAVEALTAMVAAGDVNPTAGAVLGALLGARDGVERWPETWHHGAGDEVVLREALAARLGVAQ
jgi:ADP-ribosylglycohydrolase